MKSQCPGASRFKQPEPEIVNCPFCGKELEIWTDEVKTECPGCNKVVMRQEGQSCLDWCRYAKECAGDDVYKKYMRNKSVTLKEKLIKELEGYFKEDKKRIDHAKNVVKFAEGLLKSEKGDWHIVIPASILHDVGIKIAESKHGVSTGSLQEEEGPRIAKGFLLKLGFRKEDIEEICEIIGHHHSPGVVNTKNFKVLYDADSLVNFKDEVASSDRGRLEGIIEKRFLTRSGRDLAKKTYLR